jgi:hypothetical protein
LPGSSGSLMTRLCGMQLLQSGGWRLSCVRSLRARGSGFRPSQDRRQRA